MSILKFSNNQPVRVALAFSDGKEVQGKFGPQVMFSLSVAPFGETSMYVPPVVAEQIKSLGIGKGEPFQIEKAEVPNGSKPKIEWKVSKLEIQTRKPVAAVTERVNGHAAVNGVPYFDLKTELVRAYDMAIDVLVEARAHAAVASLPVQFTGEDVRQLAAVIIIDEGKNRRCPSTRAA